MADTVYTGGQPQGTGSGVGGYEESFTPSVDISQPGYEGGFGFHSLVLGDAFEDSENITSVSDVFGASSFTVDHLNPEKNIISRIIDLALYDEDNVRKLGSYDIFELIPDPGPIPAAPPEKINVFVANWSRLYKWGAVIDKKRNPNPQNLTDWAVSRIDDNTGKGALFPDFHDDIHRWPPTATLDPTYMFYTGDPGIFYTEPIISHYEPDKYGVPQPVMVPDEDIVWKLDGKEVHRGWFLNMDLVERTVDIIQPASDDEQPRVILVPRRITVEAHNSAGVTTREVKYGAIDNQDGHLIEGNADANNFSSTYEGRYHAVETVGGTRKVEFEKDPRYGARQCFIRFEFDGYDTKYAPKSKFKDAEFHWTIGYNPDNIHSGAKGYAWGRDVYHPWDKGLWTPLGYIGGDASKGHHQDALKINNGYFANLFGDDGRIHQEHRNAKGGVLDAFNITDFTGGTNSALLTDEPSSGFKSILWSFWRKPGPFEIAAHTQFKRKGKMTKYFGLYTFGRKDGDAHEIKFDTPVRPIDFGVRKVKYTREDY